MVTWTTTYIQYLELIVLIATLAFDVDCYIVAFQYVYKINNYWSLVRVVCIV